MNKDNKTEKKIINKKEYCKLCNQYIESHKICEDTDNCEYYYTQD